MKYINTKSISAILEQFGGKGIQGKRIYLFGSGQYSEQFISRFSQYYEITGILDNNKEKWGTKLSEIEISSPDILKGIDVPFKIIICNYFKNSIGKTICCSFS